MASAIVDVDFIISDQDVQKVLTTMAFTTSAVGLSLFMRGSTHKYLAQQAEKRFAQEGDSASGKWAPLREATQNWRRYYGFGENHPINRRTGALEAYITRGGPEVFEEPSGATLMFPGPTNNTFLTEKMRRAQAGDSTTVARPVLGFDTNDVAAILVSLSIFVTTGAVKVRA